MTGGASNAGSSSAYIGSQTGGGTIDVQVGGVVTLNGGTGTYGGVMIGSIDDSLGATTVKLSAGKNIAATGGTGGVLLGVKSPGATGNIVDVRAGWDAAAGAPSGQAGTIALNGPVTIKTDAGGQVLVQGSGGGITLGAGTMTQGGSISINADSAVALDGAVHGEGAVLAYGAGISIGAAGSVSSNATGDAISLVSSTTFTNNYGGNPLSTPNGRWLVYAADPASVTKNGMTSAFRQYETVYGDTIGSGGNGFIYASAPGVLNVDTTLVSGTASNTFGTAPTAVFGHVIAAASAATADNEDLAAITGTPAFTPTITAATNVGPYTILYDSGLASAAGYTFAAGAGLAYTVNAVVLQVVTASLTGTTTKVYDGTNIASLTSGNFLLTGWIGSDSATVTKTTGIYDLGKNVGTGLSVSTTLAPGDFVAGGSTNLGNYTLPTSAQGNIGTITKAPISAVTGITAASKVYNRSTSAALNTAGAAFTGIYGGDVLTVARASGAFADKNAGTGKTVNISGITLGGGGCGELPPCQQHGNDDRRHHAGDDQRRYRHYRRFAGLRRHHQRDAELRRPGRLHRHLWRRRPDGGHRQRRLRGQACRHRQDGEVSAASPWAARMRAITASPPPRQRRSPTSARRRSAPLPALPPHRKSMTATPARR
jgi:hypothetical protein